MNILFASYGGFDCNSSPFIAGYADALTRLGHYTAVAVAERQPDDLRDYQGLEFLATDHASTWHEELFPDGRPADVLHAWTPREIVRKFAVRYSAKAGCKVVVHMEDNEEHICEAVAGRPFAGLVVAGEQELAACLPPTVSHSRRYKLFLDYADAATVVWPSLEDFLPRGLAVLHLPVCPAPERANAEVPAALSAQLGLTGDEKIIVYSGGISPANLNDQQALYEAVVLLNRHGIRCRLLRTGPGTKGTSESIFGGSSPFVTELGFVSRPELQAVMKLADAFVQPGADDAFNRYRLPCKIPEFLAIGCPLVLPACNLGRQLRDGDDALLLRTSTAQEIADQCRRIFVDRNLATRLADASRRLGAELFDLSGHAVKLEAFYRDLLKLPRSREASADTVTEEAAFLVGALRQSVARRDLAAVGRVAAQLEYEDVGGSGVRPPMVNAEVYVSADGTFSQVRCESRSYTVGERTWLRFEALSGYVPSGDLFLRIDPMARPGFFSVHRLALIRSDTGDVVVSWNAGQLRALHDASLIDAVEGTFVSRGGDPALEVPPFCWEHPCAWVLLAEISASPEEASGSSLVSHFGHIDDLEEDLRAKEVVIAAMRASTSWRATAPLRWLGTFMLQARKALSFARSASKTLGGPGKFVALVLRQMKRYGLRGTWERATLLFSGDPHHFSRHDYTEWVRRYDTLNDDARTRLRQEAAAMADPPLISVIMPVFDPPLRFLRAALDSVLAQIYPRWELCIADDCSGNPAVRQILEEYAAKDPRIKVVFLKVNGGISAASNAALALAAGDWVALFDHDDELTEHALLLVARAIKSHPDAQLIYSDEDKIGKHGARFNPYFKPDWNPALFRSHNLITHLGVYRMDLVRRLGGFRTGFEGAQDYDLALRCVEQIRPDQILHIPHVLYHWRVHSASTADGSANAKPYAMLNGEKALKEHLARSREDACADLVGHGFRVRYRVAACPKVSLIIPTKDRVDLIRRCVTSIRDLTEYPDYEIIIVDNGTSEAEALAYLDSVGREPNVRVMPIPGEFNFSLLNNRAVAASQGEVVGLLNSDLEVVHGDWLQEMVSHAVQSSTGAVGALLLYPDGKVQHAGVVTGIGGCAGHAHRGFPGDHTGYFGRLSLISEFSSVTGACLLVRKHLYEEVGGLNETDLKIAFNDIDFCLELRKRGYRNIFTPFARLNHHESASRGYEDTREKVRRFKAETAFMQQKWGTHLSIDPHYNPNLSQDSEDFSPAWPPRTDMFTSSASPGRAGR